MSWRESLNHSRPPTEMRTAADEARHYQAGALAHLRDEFVPHMQAQTTFWHTATGVLGKKGKIMYEAPYWEHPTFSTGWMALEQPEIDRHGKTQPLPCVRLSVSENKLMQGYFAKKAHLRVAKEWALPTPPERLAQQRTDKIREFFEESGTANPHFPYLEMGAAVVKFDGRAAEKTIEHKVPGAYVPGMRLSEKELPIFPDVPPPNYKQGYGYTKSWVRFGPPKMPELSVNTFYPDHETLGKHTSRIDERVGYYLTDRDRDIANMMEMVDILQTAVQVDVSAYEHFEYVPG